MAERCVICKSENERTSFENPVQTMHCRQCGDYRATITDWRIIESAQDEGDPPLRHYLCAYVRQRNAAGDVPTLAAATWRDNAEAHRNTPVVRKLDKLLRWFASESLTPGFDVTLDYVKVIPFVDAGGPNECDFLLDTLIKQEKLENSAGREFRLTHVGWSDLQPPIGGAGIPGAVFVAMAFTPDMEQAYDAGIEPAIVTDCGLTVTHVGRIEHNDSINDVILAGIRAAQIVVADVTHQRNGVYFEGGFAMGLGRIVVWMCRADDMENVHFDTRPYNHVVWTDPEDLRKKLANRLRGIPAVPFRLATT